MSKNSRRSLERIDATPSNPRSKARSAGALRSTDRPHKKLSADRTAGRRGLSGGGVI